MAEVCMENYDPKFSSIAIPGDILVSGFNFGCGSSREQTSYFILARNIPLVVAGSFGNIFSRNSINNGLMGLVVPKLIRRLQSRFTSGGGDTATRKAIVTSHRMDISLDVKKSQIEVLTGGAGGKRWIEKVGELPPNVQEIIANGGLGKWVQTKIAVA
ncbi:uncharacterized protein Z520_06076 [Fonsecaea multimorphosa CBS 102226]|uniref:Aconitase A/isopropylmalate dehydratase small subunit swivel domain-containing protein n=1 Tax=Fonsecaea multimorphosa CBS 102226 TaxID=1442371 RepID=A0A0D2JWQ9_9EURO|nr:uncharacterized protein Z520_06076 [Fonsecaea multimorphosa CBS 102226]KIX97997.1 hypothetical protein Z520_06076 [Fonsecaea multimorphosa CBS 102226]OAL24366.1 hypothetical protein AYO22_05742 [Fonsecaea multimorphosa]